MVLALYLFAHNRGEVWEGKVYVSEWCQATVVFSIMSDKMERVHYLNALAERESKVLRPLMRCLTSTEVCDLLDLDFSQPPRLRETIIQQILIGMSQQFEDCHKKLIENLLSRYDSLPATKRITWAYVLESVCSYCDEAMRERITKLFLNSDRKDFRNRGYNIINRFWNEEIEQEIVSIWLEKHEYNATVLLLERAAPEFIQEHFSTFYNLLDFRFMGKLFSRVPVVDDEILLWLKEDDAITYTYVLASLDRTLAETEAVQIYEENKLDHRSGILIWAFGKMKLWDVLVHVDADHVALSQSQFNK